MCNAHDDICYHYIAARKLQFNPIILVNYPLILFYFSCRGLVRSSHFKCTYIYILILLLWLLHKLLLD